MAKPTINKVEIAEMALRDLLRFDLSGPDKAVLDQALATVTGLRPNVNAADHMPVYTTARNGDKNVIGCSCGEVPAKRPGRSSMMQAPFNSHLAKVGVPRDYSETGNQVPRYTDGPRAGMTWNEAYKAGLTG